MSKGFFMLSLIVVLCVLSFGIGYWFANKRFPSSEIYEVSQPLEIQISPTAKGEIPKGTKLYKYRDLPEITTYYIFVNLKERTVVIPQGKSAGVIDPIDAYPISE